VKSLLRQAGTLKRKEPKSDENPVLCRALRDFNLPKITTLDLPIFLRLIRDLFPGCDPAPFKDATFEKSCIDVVKSRGLQADQGFILKIVGLADILKVRHCCFIIGTTGCGKSETWKSLAESLRSVGQDGLWEQVNPKAITSDELYGTMSKTKEWKDGAIAVIVRNMSKEINGYKAAHVHKWMILDGDIDATWIESMNTVMDDNKILTLVSNERIPFTSTMRMLLEVQDMKHASPATVSRGGVLFINEGDIGWKPFVESWRERMESVAQSTFYLLFANYFEHNIEQMRKQFTFSCPILDMGFVQSITCFLDAQLYNNTKEEMEALRAMPVEDQKLVYECFFTFALMWTLGGAVADDKIVNNRKNFSQTMKQLAKGVKFPEQGECFDYRFDMIAKEWVHWDQWVTKYDPIADRMFQNIIVSTVEIERMKYTTGLNMSQKRPVLFVGVAGTGKTTIVKDYLVDVKLKDENMISASMNMNSYTTSFALQAIMMGNLDKRSGHTYGPPSHKRCIFFIDDLNMPHVDAYDTQSAIMLLTQIMSYGQVYDRTHLEEKRDIVDVLYIGCMNPKSGSFMINARLQRHFTVCTTFLPSTPVIVGIYAQILGKHLSSFSSLILRLTDTIVSATGDILLMIQNNPHFLPSATKFHYQFNLKDIANIFQGCLNTNPAMYREGQIKFLRVWLHECYRQFSDRLVNEQDHKEMQMIIEKVIAKNFIGMSKEELFAQP
jgi:dynein heavy chain